MIERRSRIWYKLNKKARFRFTRKRTLPREAKCVVYPLPKAVAHVGVPLGREDELLRRLDAINRATERPIVV